MQPLNDPAAKAAVLANDRSHVFHSWSAQSKVNPFVLAGAQGSYVYDYDGNEYLDLSSQLVNTNIGHQHPRVVAAIKEQADRLCTVAPQHANDVRGEAARLIVERRHRGRRARRAHGPPPHRSAQGADALSLLPRRDHALGQPDR
jgi:taurine--2-oxoglutarate transaminase